LTAKVVDLKPRYCFRFSIKQTFKLKFTLDEIEKQRVFVIVWNSVLVFNLRKYTDNWEINGVYSFVFEPAPHYLFLLAICAQYSTYYLNLQHLVPTIKSQKVLSLIPNL